MIAAKVQVMKMEKTEGGMRVERGVGVADPLCFKNKGSCWEGKSKSHLSANSMFSPGIHE